jgi:hypothetical protein
MTTIRLLFTLLFLTLIAGYASADTAAGVGVVRGQVNYCGKGGVDGMQVYVPGRQYVVITGADGKFLFDQLPEGEYILKFKLGDRVFKHVSNAYVFKQRINELGEVAFCGDGVASGTLSAPPAPPAPRPPAPPSRPETQAKQPAMQGQGECTEGTIVNISNGTAECKGGKLKLLSCSKGRGDCDGDIKNGCEVDLMEDNDNCGSCGNACSMLETCVLGSC